MPADMTLLCSGPSLLPCLANNVDVVANVEYYCLAYYSSER